MPCMQRNCAPSRVLVEQALDIHSRRRTAYLSLRRFLMLAMLLFVLMVDISEQCPCSNSWWYYLEYTAALVIGAFAAMSALDYVIYLFETLITPPLMGMLSKRKFLNSEVYDSSFVTKPTPPQIETNYARKYINKRKCYWNWYDETHGPHRWGYYCTSRSRLSPQDQLRQQKLIQSWNMPMNCNRLWESQNTSCYEPMFPAKVSYNFNEFTPNEANLNNYLRELIDFERNEKTLNEATQFKQLHSLGSMYPNSPMQAFYGIGNYSNRASTSLRNNVYQMSTVPKDVTWNSQVCFNGGLKFIEGYCDLFREISYEKRLQYVTNLRAWISLTILRRLALEIPKINETLQARGFPDMLLGTIGLDRLRNAAANRVFVNQFAPTLPVVLQFLNISNDQAYLVERIKDLAKGSFIADYRWNSGYSYYGRKWNEHLPTDSALIFHIFCVYMDCQLMPLPQNCRPFHSRYVVMGDENCPENCTLPAGKNKENCAILCTNPSKPRFNFITDKGIHPIAYDNNNLFNAILQFLIFMKTNHGSTLDGVDMGTSGINIICVLGNN